MSSSPATITNFGGNVTFQPSGVIAPRDEAELLWIMAEQRGRKFRAVGRLHSWSDAAIAEDVLVDLRRLNHVEIEQREDGPWAIVGGGCQIKRILSELQRQANLTLPTLGLITEQSIAGAISTGTHGSGKHSLSHYMAEIRVAVFDEETGAPTIRTIDSGPELQAARCALGCCGLIVSVAFRCREQYLIEEHAQRLEKLSAALAAEEQFPLQQFFLIPWAWCFLAQHRREVTGKRSWYAGFYHWLWFLSMDVGFHIWVKTFVNVIRSAWYTKFFYRRLMPSMMIRGWHVVDESQTMLVMEHELFRHIEIEIFFKRSRLTEAEAFIEQTLKHFAGDEADWSSETQQKLESLGLWNELNQNRGRYVHHYPICFRRVLPDDTLLSPASGSDEDWYAVSFISYHRPHNRGGFFAFARFLARAGAGLFSARPHWGKLCPLTAEEVAAIYPRLEEFRQASREFDPTGLFRNAWVDQILFPQTIPAHFSPADSVPEPHSSPADSRLQ